MQSSALCNSELVQRSRAKLFIAARGRFTELGNSRPILDDLGVMSGDLVQSNGIVWVEGPSDRIYIKEWLNRNARATGRNAPVEGVHYSLVSYGGALLKHLTLSSTGEGKVNLWALNHNWFIVIDRDIPEGSQVPLAAEKRRILAEAEETDRPANVWITQGYTIEAYLPERFGQRLSQVSGRLSVVGTSKVELAQSFQNDFHSWGQNHRLGTDRDERMAGLFETIEAWQTPQEMIELPFIPLFLLGSWQRGGNLNNCQHNGLKS